MMSSNELWVEGIDPEWVEGEKQNHTHLCPAGWLGKDSMPGNQC